MIRALLLMITFILSLEVRAQHLVGNGGEGILDNGDLYIRDLYERDLHKDLFFGSEINKSVRAQWEKKEVIAWSTSQRDLFLRKLSDLETLYPCLGVTLVRAIQSYVWSFETIPLGLLPEEDAVRHFDDSRRIQIANRYIHTIRIYQGAWSVLSDEHKIALIMHEIFYAVQVPNFFLGSQFAKQSMGLTRDLVSLVFSDNNGNKENFNKLASSAFGIELSNLECQESYQLSVKLVKNIRETYAGIPVGGYEVHKFFETAISDPKSVPQVVRQTCELVSKVKKTLKSDEDFISLHFDWRTKYSNDLVFKSYLAKYGMQEGLLEALRILSPPTPADINTTEHGLETYEDCQRIFDGYLKN